MELSLLHEGTPARNNGDQPLFTQQRKHLASRGAGYPEFLHERDDTGDTVSGLELAGADPGTDDLRDLPVRRHRGRVVDTHLIKVDDQEKRGTSA